MKTFKMVEKLERPICVIGGDTINITFSIDVKGFIKTMHYFEVKGFELRVIGEMKKEPK